MTDLLVTALHTCEGHPGGHVGTFTPVAFVRLGCGCTRFRVRRCDGTPMQLLDGHCSTHDPDFTTEEPTA